MSDPQPAVVPRIPKFTPAPPTPASPAPPPTPVKLAATGASKSSGAVKVELPAPAPLPVPKLPLGALRKARLPKKEGAFRVLVALVLAGSLLLVWWTYARVLIPAQRQAKELSATVSRLSSEVDRMDRKLSGAEAQEVAGNFTKIGRQLIGGPSELNQWVANLHEQVVPLALDARANFGESQLRQMSFKSLALIPATISIQAEPARGIEGIESPYQRLVRLALRLATQEQRADITELHVTGGPQSVTSAELKMNLWAGEDQKPQ